MYLLQSIQFYIICVKLLCMQLPQIITSCMCQGLSTFWMSIPIITTQGCLYIIETSRS